MNPSAVRSLFCGPVLAALAFSPLAVQSANVTWDGNGDAAAGGLWEAGVNWSTNAIPANVDNAQLLDVTSGTREVTISSGSPQTINRLTITQTTAGAFNVLNVNDNLTISATGVAPFAITATAGQGSILTHIAAGKTLLVTNSASGNLDVAFNGTLNLAAGSVFRIEALNSSGGWMATPSFGGPLNVTGAGAEIIYKFNNYVANPTFNGAVTLSGAGSTLSVKALLSTDAVTAIGGTGAFNGNDGSGNAVKLDAGTTLTLASGSYAFANRVLLAGAAGPDAGAVMQIGSGAGNAVNVQTFNGELQLGADAQLNVTGGGGGVSVVLNSVTDLAAGAVFTASTNGNQGAMLLTNTGTFTMDASTFTFDYAAAGNNTNTSRYFSNSGTWVLKNGSVFNYISSTGRQIGGGWVGTNSNNSGSLSVESGSQFSFGTLFNTGTLNAGSATNGVSDGWVGLGGGDNVMTNITLTNGVTSGGVDDAGAINILGNTRLGRTVDTGTTTRLDNGDATSAGSVINVGDGITPTAFSLSNRNVVLNNYAGNTINLNSGATMLLTSTATANTAAPATFTNSGTFNHTGALSFQGNFNGARTFSHGSDSVYRISGQNAAINALAGSGSGTSVAAITFTSSGRITGTSAYDKLTYTNSSGNASFNTLTITQSGGEITAGNGTNGSGASSIGTLEFVNTNITLTGATKLSFDIGGLGNDEAPLDGNFDPILTFDRILLGASRTFALGTGAVLDIWMTNGFVTETAQTYTLIDTGLGGEGTISGSFASLLFQGQALDDDQYTVNIANGAVSITLAAGLGTPIPEPSTYATLLAAVAAGAALLRRRRCA